MAHKHSRESHSEDGMKGTTMPKEHFSMKEPMTEVCGEKYATEMGNPKDLKKSTDALVNYTRKNKMKY